MVGDTKSWEKWTNTREKLFGDHLPMFRGMHLWVSSQGHVVGSRASNDEASVLCLRRNMRSLDFKALILDLWPRCCSEVLSSSTHKDSTTYRLG